MARTLPEQIVAAVTALAEELAAWVEEGGDRALAEHEAAVLARVRRALPRLLAAVVEQATSEPAPRVRRAGRACPACGRKARPHQERARQVPTVCGVLDLERGKRTTSRAAGGAGAPPRRRWGWPGGRG